MHYLTQKSIDIANKEDYLDRLLSIYPMIPDEKREINSFLWDRIEKFFNEKNDVELLKTLLSLDLFPIKDSYIAYFRQSIKQNYKLLENQKTNSDIFIRNPLSVKRICNRLYMMGLNEIHTNITIPKETNRQIGPMFKNWLTQSNLGYEVVGESKFFSNNDNYILDASEDRLKKLARDKFNYQRNKGIDFFARVNGKYIIGETKFLTDFGGHQNAQFEDALALLDTHTDNVIKINILDGVLYLYSNGKQYKKITESNDYIFSALCLKEFLDNI